MLSIWSDANPRAGRAIPFGSPNTPVEYGFWRRYDPSTNRERFLHFDPAHNIPNTLAQNSPREASPTGKSGVGYVTWRVPRQPVEQGTRKTLVRDTNPIHKGWAKLFTKGVINPYATFEKKKQNPPSAFNPKWGP